MKAYDKITGVICLLVIVVFAGANLYAAKMNTENIGQERVEIERVVKQIAKNGREDIDLGNYSCIIAVENEKNTDRTVFYKEAGDDCVFRVVDGTVYRIQYRKAEKEWSASWQVVMNVALGSMASVLILFIFYMRVQIIRPFYKLRELPFELAKGNLTIPLKENKNHFFGRFLWGMDLLRETLEEKKMTELSLQKEKKRLILSLSHDIKTPLSAIKLYAKALSRDLYNEREKRHEAAERINDKADEIEAFVEEIMTASQKDFLHLAVCEGEFYLAELMDAIAPYYKEKAELYKTDFRIAPYKNCLLKGDLDRGIEVLQNVIENALKYGDGHGITLTFSQEEQRLLITVSNGGCTLAPEELSHIFDSFWRGSNTANKKGNGLGLYIGRQLMNRMGGEIFAACKEGEMQVTILFVQR